MLFNSLTFAVFLPIVFGLYWWLGRRKNGTRAQNVLLLLGSYVFYGWWDPRFLVLIFVSSLTDYLIGKAMTGNGGNARKRLLYLSLTVNLGLLGFFKYFNFFAESLASAMSGIGVELGPLTLNVILPVGISFYTFQTLSYTIDIYRGKIKASRDPIAFFTFVAFFPQLVAGPIEKARDLLPQFSLDRSFSYPQAVSGLRLILYGILKKVLIADRLAEYVDQVYSAPADHPGLNAFVGAAFFLIQVYCDFSGYSDIAIGAGKLFGIRLSTNFRTPLFARSVAEFWRRWHISLNAWFRDYVYQPLGGRERGVARSYFNVATVFLISGLWHGAAWTFVIWGGICALAYMAEGIIGRKNGSKGWIFRLGGNAWTLLAIVLSFIFFRATSFNGAWTLLTGLGEMFTAPFCLPFFDSELNAFLPDQWEFPFLVALLGLFLLVEALIGKGSLDEVLDGWPKAVRWGFYYAAIALLLLFGAYGTPQQFIYFQF